MVCAKNSFTESAIVLTVLMHTIDLKSNLVISIKLIANVCMERSAILLMKRRYVNILKEMRVIKGNIAPIGMCIKPVPISIWDSVFSDTNVILDTSLESFAGTTCTDFVKKEVSAKTIILKFLTRGIWNSLRSIARKAKELL